MTIYKVTDTKTDTSVYCEYDDNAFNIVSNNGGINELAINERGQLVCVNSKGDFKFLLP